MMTIAPTPGQAGWPDTFENLDNWEKFGGSPAIDSTLGDGAPSLWLNNLSSENSFGAQADSVYLENPITTGFQDGVIEFDIFFDNQPNVGDVAVITFRMLGSKTYYGALLTNTKDWTSSFIVAREGEITRIGNQSEWQAFPTRSWSHIVITVTGSLFTLVKDNKMLLSATDSNWSEGKWGGVGIYAGYLRGMFHIDNFFLRDTSKPLTYTAAFTEKITTFTTSIVISTSETTTVQTTTSVVTTTSLVTSRSILTLVVTNLLTTNTTSTSTLTQAIVPVPLEATAFIALIGFTFALLGGYYLHPNRVVTGVFAYGFGVLTFFFAALSQKWLTFTEGTMLLVDTLVPPIAGFALGWSVAGRSRKADDA